MWVFRPKLLESLRHYDRSMFLSDLAAGVTVGIVALPLAIGFAIASGVEPARGLWTAIIAGFLVSALGGSLVQIGGPTGAFVPILFGIVAKSTYNRGLLQCQNKDPDNCNSQGVEDGKNAHTQATVSTVAFIAGGALLGGGALLYFTAPRSGVTVAPTVGLGSAGMRIGGSF